MITGIGPGIFTVDHHVADGKNVIIVRTRSKPLNGVCTQNQQHT